MSSPVDTIFRDPQLRLDTLPIGAISRVQIEVVGDGIGNDILVPLLVARGKKPGPVVGLTAAVHGNELNGIRVIHDLFAELDVDQLRGTLVAVVVVNVPGLHAQERAFTDGRDLNHMFPGRHDGNVSEVFASRILDRIVTHFDVLVDLHTASFGRKNSLYVRADMTNTFTARMAYLSRPQIIVHNPASDHTLRGSAMDMDIPAITIEIGDPQRFQKLFTKHCRAGIRAIMGDAGALRRRSKSDLPDPVLCERSYWVYTDRGGLLDVLVDINERVEVGQPIGRLTDAFGQLRRTYVAPEAGIVVGRSTNPVGQTGARILHLGIEARPDHTFVRRGTVPRLAEQLEES